MTEKTWPRCGNRFECHHDDDIMLCQCAGIRLTDGARLYMHLHYEDQCLCRNCMLELNKMFPNQDDKG